MRVFRQERFNIRDEELPWEADGGVADAVADAVTAPRSEAASGRSVRGTRACALAALSLGLAAAALALLQAGGSGRDERQQRAERLGADHGQPHRAPQPAVLSGEVTRDRQAARTRGLPPRRRPVEPRVRRQRDRTRTPARVRSPDHRPTPPRSPVAPAPAPASAPALAPAPAPARAPAPTAGGEFGLER
jgi:hypothetical protein